ncbi:MAG TPA: hypothetical protein VIC29_18480 [Steroidobacteraceae bacterium]|jgi:hypothetical protein
MIRTARLTLAGPLAAAAAAVAAGFPAAAGTLPFAITHRIEVTGGSPIAALAFAPDGRQAYAAAGDELRSFDVATGEPGAVVQARGQLVGLATSSEGGGSLYAAVRAPARLLVLSLHPLRIRADDPIRSGAPSALLYELGEHALYVESRSGHSVARLDSGDGKTIGVARLQGDLAQMAGDGRGTLYVANPAGDTIDVIATDKMRFTGAIPTPNCHAPTGLDLDPVGRRLFVACGNGTALVIDTDMGFAFEQLPIQKGAPLRTVFTFHPGGPNGWKGGAFIAGDGPVLDAIRMNAFISYTSAGSMPLSGPATALAVSPAGGQLWIALAPHRADVEILALSAGGGAQ